MATCFCNPECCCYVFGSCSNLCEGHTNTSTHTSTRSPSADVSKVVRKGIRGQLGVDNMCVLFASTQCGPNMCSHHVHNYCFEGTHILSNSVVSCDMCVRPSWVHSEVIDMQCLCVKNVFWRAQHTHVSYVAICVLSTCRCVVCVCMWVWSGYSQRWAHARQPTPSHRITPSCVQSTCYTCMHGGFLPLSVSGTGRLILASWHSVCQTKWIACCVTHRHNSRRPVQPLQQPAQRAKVA